MTEKSKRFKPTKRSAYSLFSIFYSLNRPGHSKRGFTYVEMLAVVALLALCFVPLLRMFSESMNEVQIYSDIGTALQLSREAMESVKNLRFTEAQIENQGTVWHPKEKESPLILNGHEWKVKRWPVEHSDPLEVHVAAFRIEDMKNPILEIATLIEDL